MMNEFIATNQRNWDSRVAPHMTSADYDLAGFRQSRCSLKSIELEELGHVTDKTLLHLQCHFGMDTLSWVERGAIVTGVDFSEQAILQARKLAAEMDIDATFIQSDVYALPERLTDQFEVVYTSYGVLCWLGDLSRWAQIVADALKPGGIFYIVEGHPAADMFTVDSTGGLRAGYSYFNSGPARYESAQSYLSESHEALQATTTYQWEHSMGEIITSLIEAGLQIKFLHEFPYAAYPKLSTMQEGDDGWWRLPDDNMGIPFLFSLLATKCNATK
ncbi:MAG: class I SAM-dependent methyltransferase [Chloroflexota bacterium]